MMYSTGKHAVTFVDLRIIDDGMDGLEPFAVQRKHVFHVVFHDFTSQDVRRYRSGSPAIVATAMGGVGFGMEL